MPNSRYTIRTPVAQFFGGTTVQAGTGCYYNGPLAAVGLSAVYPRFPKRVPDINYTLFAAGRSMGAVMVVHLPKVEERRIAIAGANNGWKRITVMTELHFYHLAQQPHAETAQTDLEQLLDNSIDFIESDRTLGGIVTEAGESLYGIQSVMDVPSFQAPERTETYAAISFESLLFFQA